MFEDLARKADVVIEGLRPGALVAPRPRVRTPGVLNPAVVFVSLSGFGQSGPYRNLAAHGVAFDAYAALAEPRLRSDGFPAISKHTPVGIHAGALAAAFGAVAAVLRARLTGIGCHLDIAQADVAAVVECRRNRGGRAESGRRCT